MAELMVPVGEQFKATVTYRGSAFLQTIIQKFTTLNLLERAQASPLGQFFKCGPFRFSGTLFHQLMMRKIESKNPQETHFKLGGTPARFGVIEFALVTGMNFGETPSEEELTQRFTSDRLVNEYLNGEIKVKLAQLESAFKDCNVIDDVYKLGLCLLVEGVLIATEPGVQIGSNILRMVEDVDYFLNFPWGNLSFNRLMMSIQRDTKTMLKKVVEKKTEKKNYRTNYTVYGYAPAFQYWAYEAVLELGKKFAVRSGSNLTPRMLRWSCKVELEPTTEQCALFSCFRLSTCILLLLPSPSPSSSVPSSLA